MNEIQTTTPLIFEEGVLEQYKEKKLLYFGNGAGKGQEVLSYNHFHYVKGLSTSAIGMGGLAFEKYEKGEFEDVAYFEPFYLKDVRITTPKKKNV